MMSLVLVWWRKDVNDRLMCNDERGSFSKSYAFEDCGALI